MSADQQPLPPPTPREVEEFATACTALYLLMRANRSRPLDTTGPEPLLTESQFAILTPLTEGDLPMGKIAALAGVAQPTATRTVKQLEAAGVVARTRATGDERSVLVSLTPVGRTRWQATRRHMHQLQQDALARFAPEERPLVTRILTDLAQAIRETSPQTPD